MNRARALILSLAVGVAAIAGVFALGHTIALGQQSRSVTAVQVARRTGQLNRYEASLRKALAQKPPKLPPVPTTSASSSRQSAAPVRVVYHRPPPLVVVTHRAGGEEGHEGGEADD